jgi:hypothetical protein
MLKHLRIKPSFVFDVYEGFDQGAPFSDGVQSLVPVQVKSVELGVASSALDISDSQSKLFPR